MTFQKQPDICPICKQEKTFKFIKDFRKNKKRFFILPKTIYYLGYFKYLLIGKIPAVFLWILGKIFKRNNGIMLIKLKYEKQ